VIANVEREIGLAQSSALKRRAEVAGESIAGYESRCDRTGADFHLEAASACPGRGTGTESGERIFCYIQFGQRTAAVVDTNVRGRRRLEIVIANPCRIGAARTGACEAVLGIVDRITEEYRTFATAGVGAAVI